MVARVAARPAEGPARPGRRWSWSRTRCQWPPSTLTSTCLIRPAPLQERPCSTRPPRLGRLAPSASSQALRTGFVVRGGLSAGQSPPVIRYHLVFHGEVSGLRETSSEPSHLMLAMPTQPGTTSRSGNRGRAATAGRWLPRRAGRRRAPSGPGGAGAPARSRSPCRRTTGRGRWPSRPPRPARCRDDAARPESHAFPGDGADGTELPLGAGGGRALLGAVEAAAVAGALVHCGGARRAAGAGGCAGSGSTASCLGTLVLQAVTEDLEPVAVAGRSAASWCGHGRRAAAAGSGSGRGRPSPSASLRWCRRR